MLHGQITRRLTFLMMERIFSFMIIILTIFRYLSSYSYASEGPRAIKLVAESGTLKVKSLVLHHMKSIGLE